MKKYKIAVIGCGHWGANHIRVFNSLPDSTVVFAVDRDEERLNYVRAFYPLINCEKDFRLILENSDVDAIVISTPTSTHYQLTYDSLMAGKNVLCEKPLCVTTNETKELFKIAEEKKLVLMVGYTFLFNSGILKLKELIDSNSLGYIYYLSSIRTNLGPVRSDVNSLYDLATHDISIFNFFMNGEPEVLSATGACYLQKNFEDVVVVTLKYPNGTFASISVSWLDPKKVRYITVSGDKKMATWNDLDLESPITIYNKGVIKEPSYNNYGEFLRLSLWEGEKVMPKVSTEEPLKTQAKFFIDCLKRGQISKSDGDFSVGVVKTLETASLLLRQNSF